MIPLVLTSLSFGAGSEIRAVVEYPKIMIQMKFYSGDPLGSEEKKNVEVLSSPSTTLMNKQTATIQVGQSINPQAKPVKSGIFEKGITAKMTPKLEAEDSVRLDFQISIVDGDELIKHLKGIEFTTVFKNGETQKIRISANSPWDQKWVEISVKVISSAKEAQKLMEVGGLKWTSQDANSK